MGRLDLRQHAARGPSPEVALASWTVRAHAWIDGLGQRIARGLDQLRIDAGIPAVDVTALTIEPVENASTSGFGWREDPITHRRKFHSGADIRGKHGTPVMAAGEGTVVFTGRRGGYGNLIEIDHGHGLHTRYAHLRRIEVKKGAEVGAGQRIGQVGSTGRATGPHLHFEVRIDNHPMDPLTALTVAELERTSPAAGHLAAQLLTPEIQGAKLSDVDPPRGRHAARRARHRTHRHHVRRHRGPRSHHVRAAKPLS